MKFGQPILTSELSGSIGGATASSARGGVNYFRVRRNPGNPRSPEQTRLRTILSSVAAGWIALTTAQRAAWSALAGSGESGIDVYTDCNVPLMQGGGARVTAAPAGRTGVFTPPTIVQPETGNPPDVTGISATDTWNATAGGVLNIYVSTGIQTESRLSQQFPFRFGASLIRAGAAKTNADVNAAIELALAAVGMDPLTFVPGNVLYLKFLARGVTGKTSQAASYRIVVVAP